MGHTQGLRVERKGYALCDPRGHYARTTWNGSPWNYAEWGPWVPGCWLQLPDLKGDLPHPAASFRGTETIRLVLNSSGPFLLQACMATLRGKVGRKAAEKL